MVMLIFSAVALLSTAQRKTKWELDPHGKASTLAIQSNPGWMQVRHKRQCMSSQWSVKGIVDLQ